MIKRVGSEVRVPGMVSTRQCRCGALLADGDGERCTECRPCLSMEAQAASAHRRQQLHEIEQAEREIENLGVLIKRLTHKVEISRDCERDEGHRRHQN